MRPINLLPPARVAARRLRHRTRRWSMAVSAYASLVTCAVVALRATSDPAPPAKGNEAAQARLDAALADLDGMALEAQGLAARLRITSAFAARVDWSLLLESLATCTAEDTFLERTALVPAAGRAGETRLVLDIDALALDQGSQSRFVLAVEALGLFERVELLETRRRAVAGHEAFAFRLRCPLKEKL